MIKVQIADANGGDRAEIVESTTAPPGLMVYNQSYQAKENANLAAINSQFGLDMAINGAAGGTPEHIHNGTDNVYWTAVATSGTWDFASTAQALDGTRSIDATATVNNNVATITAGSPVTFSNYVSISGGIYITSWPVSGVKEVRLQFSLSGSPVGNIIDLSDYINEAVFNSWQNFNIPLDDFTLPGTQVDALLVTTIDTGSGAAPDYYLDKIQLEETGSGYSYFIRPPEGQAAEVDSITIAAVGPATSMSDLIHNEFFGISQLPTGLGYRRYFKGEVVASFNVRDNFSLASIAMSDMKVIGSNGTLGTFVFDLLFPTPLKLIDAATDYIEIIIQDDLSSLTELRVIASGSLLTDAV